MKIELGTKASRTVWIKRDHDSPWERVDPGEQLPRDVTAIRINDPEEASK